MSTSNRHTILSSCRQYRYTLWREWWPYEKPGYVAFVCLNPSTADEAADDHTLRKCIGFANRWGYGAVCIVNLFAWRATDPEAMFAAADPVGADNDEHLAGIIHGAALVVPAWGGQGTDPRFLERVDVVKTMLKRYPGHSVPLCLGLTQDGHPRHPSRPGYATQLTAFV